MIKKILLALVILTSVPQVKAEDMDPVTGAVLIGSASVFGTMVGTTALLSADRLNDDNNAENQTRRLNPQTGGINTNLLQVNQNLFGELNR